VQSAVPLASSIIHHAKLGTEELEIREPVLANLVFDWMLETTRGDPVLSSNILIFPLQTKGTANYVELYAPYRGKQAVIDFAELNLFERR
jgi:hypothetical protein